MISDEARAEAVEYALVMADWWIRDAGWTLDGWHPDCGLGASGEANCLARACWSRLLDGPCRGQGLSEINLALWLEVAALLRDGWSPGDPVPA